MPISSPGVGSGLDVKTIVNALVQADITPSQLRHDKELRGVSTELSAIGQVKGALSSLQSSLSQLSDITLFGSKKYTNSDPDFLSATVAPEAAKGSYQVEITQLAQQHTLASGYLTTTGSGTMTITLGTYSSNDTVFTANPDKTPVNITIASGSDSLTSVRDAINNAKAGVTASIVQDSQGQRLTISSNDTGVQYAMKITGTISALNYDRTMGVNSLTQTVQEKDSIVKVNGLTLTQSSNQLKDAISGLTLNLKKAEVGTITTISIDDNKDQITNMLNDFIKKYNDTITMITSLTGYNASTKTGGPLQGDPQLRAIKYNLTRLVTTPLANTESAIKSIADIGLTINRQGMLQLDQTKYQNTLSNNYADIGTLFAKTATATDPDIRVKAIDTDIKAGSYDINLTEFTPGVSMSGTIGGFNATSSDGIVLNGSKDLTGLSLSILSGSTGSRGQVVVKDGIAVNLYSFLDSYLAKNGDIQIRTDQLNKEVNDLTKMQEKIDSRTQSLTDRYNKQFTALDDLISKLQKTSTFLSQQLANLPQIGK